MFIKRKRDGRIKGRGCADGRKQWKERRKSNVSSPKITTDAVFLVLTIAAKEGSDEMVMKIPGAFLQTKLKDKDIHVQFEGRMVELLVMIDHSLYRPCVIIERGNPVLYAQLRKELYGMPQSALHFWKQILNDLEVFTFKVNPYHWCVANCVVNGAQQTVASHDEDFLVTHNEQKVNKEFAACFNKNYGKRDPVTVQFGKNHDYLGIQVDPREDAMVRINMEPYIDEMLIESPDGFYGTALTPAAKPRSTSLTLQTNRSAWTKRAK